MLLQQSKKMKTDIIRLFFLWYDHSCSEVNKLYDKYRYQKEEKEEEKD